MCVYFYIIIGIDFNKYLLRTPYAVSGTILGICDTCMNKINKKPFHDRASVLSGGYKKQPRM